MIKLAEAHELVARNFKKDFGGMNMLEETAIEFCNLVMHNAFNGRGITTKEALANAYKATKISYFGVNA